MSFLETPIEYLKGVGPQKAKFLASELSIHSFSDLIHHFPYRYVDRSQETPLHQLDHYVNETVSVKGILVGFNPVGFGQSKRLSATLNCHASGKTVHITLMWFQSAKWIEKTLHIGVTYLCHGKLSLFKNNLQIVHPEMVDYESWLKKKSHIQPIYSTTELLKKKGMHSKSIERMQKQLQDSMPAGEPNETLPLYMLNELCLRGRKSCLRAIHFPYSWEEINQAQHRIKLEEIFWFQLHMGYTSASSYAKRKGAIFDKVGDTFIDFYKHRLPFELTSAQKKVLKSIRKDMASGHAMNRLLQGDVGSGKTIVAFLAMLLAIDNGYQATIVAPTEVLAQQHFESMSELCTLSTVHVALLTGSTPQSERKQLLDKVENGATHILVGTHALFGKQVVFKKLGLAIIDEQHRFGVQQRATLLQKESLQSHALIMTATPIPRTLAMTAYSDLDYSVIDELPPGRKPVQTIHRWDSKRIQVFELMLSEIQQGRQAYIVFPLIQESEKLHYEDLMNGYEQVKSFFNQKNIHISLVHGKMGKEEKQINMKRFVEGKTKIMVATTVIEVGVNVPNASFMLIESSEKFGLSQLHQLRGRVGRSDKQSYCILMSGHALSQDAKVRIQTMCSTSDGFKIAEKDLELRGPGDIQGTRQSGGLPFKMCNLISDKKIIFASKGFVESLLSDDSQLNKKENILFRKGILKNNRIQWLHVG